MSLRTVNKIPLNPPLKKGERNVPKTGLSARMRDWMKSRAGTKAQRHFTIEQMTVALGIWPGKEHQAVANALTDFVTRGEVESYYLPTRRCAPGIVRSNDSHSLCSDNQRLTKKRNRRQYLYIQDWHKVLKGKVNKKIFKAMYVSQTFAVTDLQRLTGITERNWFDKIIRQLKEDGHITQIQRRLCAHGAGAENVYHITDRDKFNREMMR